MNAGPRRSIWVTTASLVALVFGLLTIREGGLILFGDEAARAAAGKFVPFVLWFNFSAGFAYFIAGAGLWVQQRWAAWLAIAIASATALTFVAFGVHVSSGGAWEQRTVIAMTLRTVVWIVLAASTSARISTQEGTMNLSFHGAAREVTGSCYLVESTHSRFLVDCGMVQGGRRARTRNQQPFPFDPKSIDFVLLTHAHIQESEAQRPKRATVSSLPHNCSELIPARRGRRHER